MKTPRLHPKLLLWLGLPLLLFCLLPATREDRIISGVPAEAVVKTGTLVPPPAAVTDRRELPRDQEAQWKVAVTEPPFAAFQTWVARYQSLPAAERPGLVAEGERLAAERREALKVMIRRLPERALELAVPEAVRRAMPASVAAQLEEKVDARGDLLVTAISPATEGQTMPANTVATRYKAVLAGGQSYTAFVYGRRDGQPTRWDVPLHGIALDGQMAISQWPGRVLEPIERAEAKQALASPPECPVSQLPSGVTETEVAVQTGTAVAFYCGPGHAANTLESATEAESLLPPGFGYRTTATVNAASGAAGQSVPNPNASGVATWTTGFKRVGVVRVSFTSFLGEIAYQHFTQPDCIDILAGIGQNWLEWSQERCTIRGLSSTGSFITPVLQLPKGDRDYDEAKGVDEIWKLAAAWAESHGRAASSYEYLIVLAGTASLEDAAGKSAWWGGIAQVGAKKSLLRTTDVEGTISVALHELGHNLGLSHSSNRWTEPQWATNADGVASLRYGEEYGDRYDTMGHSVLAYNVRYKHWLRWLDDSNVPVAVTDGLYTIQDHDRDETSGVRGLQVPLDLADPTATVQTPLFVEYRLHDPAHPYLARGALIHIGSKSGPKTWLYDGTPETPNHEPGDPPDISGNLDSPLLPGRTFSITRTQGTLHTVHITNLSADPDTGKLVVEIEHDTPAGNVAPTGSLSATSPAAAVNQKIVFTCAATDADGDDLAWHWQVPGAGPFANVPSVSASFATTGSKTIKCIVSDKHGGVVTLTMPYSVVVNQPPSVSTIPNYTIDEDGTLLNLSFTVNDATTPAGDLVVTATSDNAALFPAGSILIGTLGGATRLIHLTPAANKHGVALITVKASDGVLSGIEQFNVTVRPVSPGTALVTSGGSWKYWDAAAAPGGAWKESAYDDSAWQTGTSRFVYGQGLLTAFGWTSLATVPGRATTYYRRSFNVPAAPAGIPMLRLLCDDSAVVYLDGVEVYRQNLPAGLVTHATRTPLSVEGADESEWTIVPLTSAQLHLGGSSTLVVEVHDAASTRGSGDVSFDADLGFRQAPLVGSIANKVVPEDSHVTAAFTASDSETPSGGLTFSAASSNQALVRDASTSFGTNLSGNPVFICTFEPNATGVTEITIKVSDGSSETWRKFTITVTPVNDAPTIQPLAGMAVAMGELAPVVELTVDDIDNDPASLTVTAASSNLAVVPAAGLQILPGSAPNKRWLRIAPAPGIAAQSTITVNVSDGAASTSTPFIFNVSLPLSVTSVDVSLVSSGQEWRYWAQALPNDPRGGGVIDFTDPALDDSTWPQGRGQLGYGGDGEVTLVPATPYRVTTYFRRTFTVPDASALSSLKLRFLRDDGAVVYLNGVLIAESNMPRATAGSPLTANTLAATGINGTAEDTWISSTELTTNLRSGVNVLAVEIHQFSLPTAAAPGDLSFDLELDAVAVPAAAEDVLISAGDAWLYWDQDVYPDDTWKLSSFVTADWKQGLARLGYGIGGESTVVNALNTAGTLKNPSVLFRRIFDVADPSLYTALHLMVQRDDGIAVHLNGARVLTDNLATGAGVGDFALTEIPAPAQTQWRHYLLDSKKLIAGRNLLAVSVHQASIIGADLNFDLQLSAVLSGNLPPLFIRDTGPTVELSWPAAFNAWSLQASINLGPGPWLPLAEPPLLDAGWIYVLTPRTTGQRFFRLRKP